MIRIEKNWLTFKLNLYIDKYRSICHFYFNKIPPNGSLIVFIRPGCQAHRHVPFFVRAVPDGKLQYQ